MFLAVLAGLELVVLLPVSPKCWDFLFSDLPSTASFTFIFKRQKPVLKIYNLGWLQSFEPLALAAWAPCVPSHPAENNFLIFFLKLSLNQLSIDYPKKENFPSMTCLKIFCLFSFLFKINHKIQKKLKKKTCSRNSLLSFNCLYESLPRKGKMYPVYNWVNIQFIFLW